jgi:hypothetical protein
MKTYTELRDMAARIGDLGRFADEEEAATHFLEVCGDLTGDEVLRLNAIFEQQAGEVKARSDAVEAAIAR